MFQRLFALGLVGMASAVQLTGVVHVVTVGRGNHKFEPNVTIADPGDVISFQFFPANHSVVRMDPSVPCKPYEMVDTTDAHGGWWSGFKPVAAFLNPPPSWNLTINDTKPLYFYCSAPDSCIKYEMVGAINPDNTTYPIDKVGANAATQVYSLSPGENWIGDGTTPTPSTPTGTSTSAPSSGSSSSGGVTLSTGAIAGIAIGGVIALALIGLLFFFVGRKKKGAEVKATMAPTTPTPGDGLMGMSEHPPVYQDPRYSQLPVGAGHWDQKAQQEEQARLASAHPHRISELPDSTTYDPVEIYTPGPEDMPEHRR